MHEFLEALSDRELLARIDERTVNIEAKLDKLNGRVAHSEQDIVNLRVRIAYWAGGAAVVAICIGWLLKVA